MAFFIIWHQVKPTAIIETYPDIFNDTITGLLLKFVKTNIKRYLTIQSFMLFEKYS